MRVLLTRPLTDAVPLAEQLAQRGHDVVLAPMIRIEPTQASLPSPDGYGALALTSANGVRALMAALPDANTAAAWQALPAYAVGPQTAAALRACQWPIIHQAAGDVSALAGRIIADRNAATTAQKTTKILHIAGTHRAGDLAAALAAQHIGCDKAVLYEAIAAEGFDLPAQAALDDADDPITAVVLYSQRSAEIFIRLYAAYEQAQAATGKKPCAYCLSPAIAELCQTAGFETRIAATPDGPAMLQLFD